MNEGKIVPVPKKDRVKTAQNLREISIISVIGRIFEHMMIKQYLPKLEEFFFPNVCDLHTCNSLNRLVPSKTLNINLLELFQL